MLAMSTRNAMMANLLYEQQLHKQYAARIDPSEPVVLKGLRGNFTCCLLYMAAIPESLHAMISQMNVRCAVIVNTSPSCAPCSNPSLLSPTGTMSRYLMICECRFYEAWLIGCEASCTIFPLSLRMRASWPVWDDDREKLLA